MKFLEHVFKYTPLNLGKKVKYTNIAEGKSVQIQDATMALEKAKIITKVPSNNCSGIPLLMGERSRF